LPGENKIKYKPVLENSGLGDSLGEEEWILKHTQTEATIQSKLGIDASRFIPGFQGNPVLLAKTPRFPPATLYG